MLELYAAERALTRSGSHRDAQLHNLSPRRRPSRARGALAAILHRLADCLDRRTRRTRRVHDELTFRPRRSASA